MATLATANLPSDDEEDQDFVPDEVDSEDETRKKQKPKRKRRVRGVAATAESDDDGDEAEEAPPARPAISEAKLAEKKAKIDEMWASLNTSKPAAKASQPLNLAALCKPVAKPKKGGADTVSAEWRGFRRCRDILTLFGH